MPARDRIESSRKRSWLDIPPEVAEQLGWYVYLYVDPRNGRPFYVGKGQGRRLLAHLAQNGECRKTRTIEAIQAAGLEPMLEVLAHRLPSEEAAFRIESAVIDLLGLEQLSNKVRGWRSIETGRMPLEQLAGYYAAKPVLVTDPSLLIRINKLYRYGMTSEEVYNVTRGIWKLGPRRMKAKYAFAVFEGVVREVFVIAAWHPAGTTPYVDRVLEGAKGRWEFTGHVASASIRSRYLGKSVASYLKKGLQSPVVYAGIGKEE